MLRNLGWIVTPALRWRVRVCGYHSYPNVELEKLELFLL